MAFVRTRRLRPKRRLRRRRKLNKMSLTRAPRASHPYVFQRWHDGGTIIQQNVPTYGHILFKLSDLPNFAEYTALFDAYRLMKVEVFFYPRTPFITNGQVPATLGSPYTFYTVVDHDDKTDPVSVDQLRQYRSFKVRANSGKFFKMTLVPKCSAVLFGDTITPIAYGHKPSKQWIDSAYPDVEHYGIKWAFDAIDGATTTAQVYHLQMKYTLNFKEPI